MADRVTLSALQQMKQDGRKIVAVVAYDVQMARIVDRVGVEIVSVGDSVGVTLWGHESELDVTLDEMLIACRAVRRGVTRALVSCDFPYGPLQEGTRTAVAAARRLMEHGGADMVKVDGASDNPELVRRMIAEGVPVWAQFGITPYTAARYGGMDQATPELAAAMSDQLVAEARLLEDAGASLLDFTNSGPVAGPAVVAAVRIPVIGGLGGGPWLDGRVRAVPNAIGYFAAALDDGVDRYANVASIAFDALKAYSEDVRAGRHIRGGPARPRA